MIQKHKSSITTFAGIYLAVALVIGGAIFVLHRSKQKAQEKVALEMTAALEAKSEAEAAKAAAKVKKAKEEAAAKAIAEAEAKKKAEEAAAKNAKLAAAKKADAKKQSETAMEEKPKVPTVSELDKELEKMYPAPEVKPLMDIVGNWKAVPAKAYPPFVNIKVPVEFEIKRGAAVIGKGKLQVGASMIPLRFDGETVVLTNSRNSATRVKLPVGDTNFKEKITEKYDAFVTAQSANAVAKRKAEKERRLGAVAAENAVSKYNDGKDPRFDVMKASIRRGESGPYQIESAGEWRWSGEEKIDGEDYNVGFVRMVSESAFGVTKKELKALIQGDKVVSWIDVASGEKL